MVVVFLIKILTDNRIELLDTHKKLTSTFKSQTTLRQAIKNRLNIPKKELSSLMNHLLTHENVTDDHPYIQGYINKPFLSTDHQEEIADLVNDQVNTSYVSNYDYDIYKKKTDTQDKVIDLLKKQLNDVVDKLDRLEKNNNNHDIVSRLSKYENDNSDLQRDMSSLRSENKLLMDKINSNPSLCPIPEIESISSDEQSINIPITNDTESINSKMIKINTRLDRIDRYLFHD